MVESLNTSLGKACVSAHPCFLVLIVLTVAACGGGSDPRAPLAPTSLASASPPPTSPSMITIDGTITDTVTGAIVGRFSQTASSLPTRVSVSAAGYITRETIVRTATPTVDLFPERGFDLAFYRQIARDDFQRNSGSMLQPLWVLSGPQLLSRSRR